MFVYTVFGGLRHVYFLKKVVHNWSVGRYYQEGANAHSNGATPSVSADAIVWTGAHCLHNFFFCYYISYHSATTLGGLPDSFFPISFQSTSSPFVL